MSGSNAGLDLVLPLVLALVLYLDRKRKLKFWFRGLKARFYIRFKLWRVRELEEYKNPVLVVLLVLVLLLDLDILYF